MTENHQTPDGASTAIVGLFAVLFQVLAKSKVVESATLNESLDELIESFDNQGLLQSRDLVTQVKEMMGDTTPDRPDGVYFD